MGSSKRPIGAWTCASCGERADVYQKGGKLLGFLYSKGCRCGFRDRQSFDFQSQLWERTEFLPGLKPSAPPPSVRRRRAAESAGESPRVPRATFGYAGGEPDWFKANPDSPPAMPENPKTSGVSGEPLTNPAPPETASAGDSSESSSRGKPRGFLAVVGAVAAAAGGFLMLKG